MAQHSDQVAAQAAVRSDQAAAHVATTDQAAADSGELATGDQAAADSGELARRELARGPVIVGRTTPAPVRMVRPVIMRPRRLIMNRIVDHEPDRSWSKWIKVKWIKVKSIMVKWIMVEVILIEWIMVMLIMAMSIMVQVDHDPMIIPVQDQISC